jgi:hypothetical protein
MSKILVAKEPILHGNVQYLPGDSLPESDTAYVEAWVRSGSAVWTDLKESADSSAAKSAAKAKRLSKRAGAEGIAQPATGAEPDLVGVVPSPGARGAVREPKKRAPKSKA